MGRDHLMQSGNSLNRPFDQTSIEFWSQKCERTAHGTLEACTINCTLYALTRIASNALYGCAA